MGPAATADFYAKLIRSTPAARDQDHLRVVIWADPTVPDRTAALLDGGPDPSPILAAGARALVAAGAEIIAIPCSTAHAFLPTAPAHVRMLHIAAETAEHMAQLVPQPRRVGLLATSGTIRAGLYQDWLGRRGIDVLVPDEAAQEEVMATIRSVKRGNTDSEVRDRLARVVEELTAAGADAIVAGCTELPLIMAADGRARIVDPTLVLARALVAAAQGTRAAT